MFKKETDKQSPTENIQFVFIIFGMAKRKSAQNLYCLPWTSDIFQQF